MLETEPSQATAPVPDPTGAARHTLRAPVGESGGPRPASGSPAAPLPGPPAPLERSLAPVGTSEAIDEAKPLERLLLIAYVYGTDSGISSVAAGEHGHSEEKRRHTAGGLEADGIEIVNAEEKGGAADEASPYRGFQRVSSIVCRISSSGAVTLTNRVE